MNPDSENPKEEYLIECYFGKSDTEEFKKLPKKHMRNKCELRCMTDERKETCEKIMDKLEEMEEEEEKKEMKLSQGSTALDSLFSFLNW